MCDFAFQPVQDPEEVRAIYDIDYFEQRSYSFDEAQRRHEARIRLDFVGRFERAPGRLLEVGSSTGFFLAEAAAAGWEATGIEPCRAVARWAAERHHANVLAAFIEDVELEPGAYDFAVGWHVLEHVPNPLAVLKKLRVALRPGGHVAFEVPNFGAVRSRRAGPRWQHLAPTVHVGQLSPRSMRALLSEAGFETRALNTVPTWAYVPRRDAMRPRQLARRTRYALETRSIGFGSHADKFDLLRVVAQRPL